MTLLLSIISFLIIGTLVLIVREICMMKKRRDTRFEWPMPAIFFWVGAACALLFFPFAFITVLQGEDAWIYCLFIGFGVFGLGLCLNGQNCKLEFDQNGFSFYNLFGRGYVYRYDQINSYFKGYQHHYLVLMTDDGKRISLPEELLKTSEFYQSLCAGYKRAHNGEELPQRAYKLFNDHVDQPVQLFVVILSAILVPIILLWWVSFQYREDVAFDELHRYSLVIERQWAEEEGPWNFKAKESNATFWVSDAAQTNMGSYTTLRAISSGTPVVVYLLETPERLNDAGSWEVYCLRSADESFDYLPFSDWQTGNRETTEVLSLMGGILVLNTLFWSFGIYVLYHAPRFPKLVKCFVQPNYLRHGKHAFKRYRVKKK